MIGSLLKAVAYGTAPKTTFAVLHPEEAFQLKKMQYDLKHAYAPRVTAVAAALLVLPLGIIIGRRWERRVLRLRARPSAPRVRSRALVAAAGRTTIARPVATRRVRPAPSGAPAAPPAERAAQQRMGDG